MKLVTHSNETVSCVCLLAHGLMFFLNFVSHSFTGSSFWRPYMDVCVRMGLHVALAQRCSSHDRPYNIGPVMYIGPVM